MGFVMIKARRRNGAGAIIQPNTVRVGWMRHSVSTGQTTIYVTLDVLNRWLGDNASRYVVMYSGEDDDAGWVLMKLVGKGHPEAIKIQQRSSGGAHLATAKLRPVNRSQTIPMDPVEYRFGGSGELMIKLPEAYFTPAPANAPSSPHTTKVPDSLLDSTALAMSNAGPPTNGHKTDHVKPAPTGIAARLGI